jgi:hypothetical protein
VFLDPPVVPVFTPDTVNAVLGPVSVTALVNFTVQFVVAPAPKLTEKETFPVASFSAFPVLTRPVAVAWSLDVAAPRPVSVAVPAPVAQLVSVIAVVLCVGVAPVTNLAVVDAPQPSVFDFAPAVVEKTNLVVLDTVPVVPTRWTVCVAAPATPAVAATMPPTEINVAIATPAARIALAFIYLLLAML